jgi:hypothetical protein
MNESDLREALRREAEAFDPTPGWLDVVPSPRDRVRRSTTAVSLMTAAAVAAAVYVATIGPAGDDSGPSQRQASPTATHETSGGTSTTVTIRLAGYESPADGSVPADLQSHLACMRDHGYDLPDPVWTGNGWLLSVDDARGLGIGTARWKRTVFVTCALTRPGGDRLKGLRDEILNPRPRAPRGHQQ